MEQSEYVVGHQEERGQQEVCVLAGSFLLSLEHSRTYYLKNKLGRALILTKTFCFVPLDEFKRLKIESKQTLTQTHTPFS